MPHFKPTILKLLAALILLVTALPVATDRVIDSTKASAGGDGTIAPTQGVAEDLVCGSGNGCVAALVRRAGLVDQDSYVARQGGCIGRDGRVEIRFDEDDTVWVGGRAVVCIEGTLET